MFAPVQRAFYENAASEPHSTLRASPQTTSTQRIASNAVGVGLTDGAPITGSR